MVFEAIGGGIAMPMLPILEGIMTVLFIVCEIQCLYYNYRNKTM